MRAPYLGNASYLGLNPHTCCSHTTVVVVNPVNPKPQTLNPPAAGWMGRGEETVMGEGSGDTNQFSLTSPRHLSTSYPNSASTQQEFQKLHRFYRNLDVCCRIVGSENILGAHLGMGRCCCSSSLLLEITSSSCGLLLLNSSLTTSRRSKRRFSQQHTVAAAPRGLLSITESSNSGRISSSPWLGFSQCSTSLPGRLHCCLPTRKRRIVVSAFQAEEDLGFQTDEEELLLQYKKVGNLFRVFHALPTDSKSLLWMPANLVDDDS